MSTTMIMKLTRMLIEAPRIRVANSLSNLRPLLKVFSASDTLET